MRKLKESRSILGNLDAMLPFFTPIFRFWIPRVGAAIAIAISLAFVLTASTLASGIYDLPVALSEDTWVADSADALSRLTESRWADTFSAIADRTNVEARVATVHRLDYGETIENFADALFERWYPTEEARSNQILLAIDSVTNTTAIRTGEGAKALLPDDIAESIAQETLLAPIRTGNKYNEGIAAANDRLAAVLSGEPDPGPPVVDRSVEVEGTFTTAEETNTFSATWIVVVLLALATIIPMATYYWLYR